MAMDKQFKEQLIEWLQNEKELGIESMDGEDPPNDPGNALWIQYLDYLTAVAGERAYKGYSLKETLIQFFNYLTANTDTFDKVMVQIERDLGDDHTLRPDLVRDLVEEFINNEVPLVVFTEA